MRHLWFWKGDSSIVFSLCAALSAEVSVGDSCSSLRWPGLPRFCRWQWQLELLLSSVVKATEALLFSFVCWKALAREIPHGAKCGVLALRVAIELVSCVMGALAVGITPVPEVCPGAGLPRNRGPGLWGLPQLLRLGAFRGMTGYSSGLGTGDRCRSSTHWGWRIKVSTLAPEGMVQSRNSLALVMAIRICNSRPGGRAQSSNSSLASVMMGQSHDSGPRGQLQNSCSVALVLSIKATCQDRRGSAQTCLAPVAGRSRDLGSRARNMQQQQPGQEMVCQSCNLGPRGLGREK